MTGFTVEQALNKLAEEGIVIISKTIGAPTFTGVGLDDFSNGGEYTGDVDIVYEVEIDGTGTPDTFKWSKDGEVQTPATINIDGSDQALDNGVTIKFNATTGHTLGDKWTFTARAADPISVQKNVETLISASILGGISIESSPVDLRGVKSGVLTVTGTYDAAAIAGMSVEIFSSTDGLTFDDDAWASTGLEPSFVANQTKQRSSNLDLLPAFIKVKVTNLEAIEALGSLVVTLTKLQE
jgi:hypothetical protein